MRERVIASLVLALLSTAVASQTRFAEVDTDGNGYVEPEEFGAGPDGIPLAKERFDEWDLNDDGRIDKTEWAKAVLPAEPED